MFGKDFFRINIYGKEVEVEVGEIEIKRNKGLMIVLDNFISSFRV